MRRSISRPSTWDPSLTRYSPSSGELFRVLEAGFCPGEYEWNFQIQNLRNWGERSGKRIGKEGTVWWLVHVEVGLGMAGSYRCSVRPAVPGVLGDAGVLGIRRGIRLTRPARRCWRDVLSVAATRCPGTMSRASLCWCQRALLPRGARESCRHCRSVPAQGDGPRPCGPVGIGEVPSPPSPPPQSECLPATVDPTVRLAPQ